MMRCFQPSDLEACVEIYVSTFARPPWNEVWNHEIVRERLEQIIRTPGFFGAVAGEDVVGGFAMGVLEPWHEGYHFHLKEICVENLLQRQGIGTGLLGWLADELAVRDVKRLYLLTARGGATEEFYRKAGFHVSPRMILMSRYLRQDDESGA